MTRDEKVATARRMRSEGKGLKAIGMAVGTSASTVWKWLNPEKVSAGNSRRREQKREWEDRNRAACPRCGDPMGAGSSCPSRTQRVCASCEREARVAAGIERGHTIERLWAEGLSRRQIADEIGTTYGSVSVMINRLRREGFDLPYRNIVTDPTFPDQVRR